MLELRPQPLEDRLPVLADFFGVTANGVPVRPFAAPARKTGWARFWKNFDDRAYATHKCLQFHPETAVHGCSLPPAIAPGSIVEQYRREVHTKFGLTCSHLAEHLV